jgi:DNA-binding XRE family transcriptional regulator
MWRLEHTTGTTNKTGPEREHATDLHEKRLKEREAQRQQRMGVEVEVTRKTKGTTEQEQETNVKEMSNKIVKSSQPT